VTVAAVGSGPRAEQTRARYPDVEGHVERDGVRVFYEVYGQDHRTSVVLLPTWSIITGRHWKAQIPYLARHFRVVTLDGRGNGRSDRPAGAAAYADDEFARDTLAVMDATATDRAVLVALSCGAARATILAAEHPDRVSGVAYLAPAVPLVPGHAARQQAHAVFEQELPTDEGWAKYNARYWQRDYRGFLEFFFGQMFPEPHSTKQVEDCVGWGLETDAETLADTARGMILCRSERFAQLCARVRCPVLVVHGDEDRIRPLIQGEALAQATGGRMVVLEGSGHGPHARDPVKVNRLLREFVEQAAGVGGPARTVWRRARSRPRRALYVSSPIGLGHARRDVAIARELRRLVPDLQVDWLAQDPVTRVLASAGERVHPASADLASESGHFAAESDGHALHCFEAFRRMDEILAANFMVFDDVVRAEQYDLWIGDEAWELDHFLHENPELKTAAYAWLTDFVGWLPVDPQDAREVALTADHNAEMIEHVSRYPWVRDRAIFVGEPEDVVAGRFGPDLPEIGPWVRDHYAFAGHVAGAAPVADAVRPRLRASLGYGPDEVVCVVTVGGSGVGGELLRRVVAAAPPARARVAGLRMIAVCGPRIDPASIPACSGVEVLGYMDDLPHHLAACDVAVVQGGLTTGMELTANGRPFLYAPLRGHCEQEIHVHHRLARYGVGQRLDLDAAGPEEIADALVAMIGRPVRARPVRRDGAVRAARLIAELL
jgi:pimeloyl-ACP methyl ester carboxylesterase/predicted glycosyltransferase